MIRRVAASALLLALLGAGCIFGSDEEVPEAANEMAELATASDTLTYEATYTFSLSGPLAEGIRYDLRITQRPPTSLRMVETTTVTAEGEERSVRQWIVQTAEGNYACTDYEEGVRCVLAPEPVGLFDLTQVDEVFRIARTPEAFEDVQELDPRTIAGERGRCFEATPDPATPPPIRSPQPRFTPTNYVFELCYSSDGVLLYAQRTITSGVGEEGEEADVPTDLEAEDRTTTVLEATSVSRTVAQEDVELPGPLRGSEEDAEG